MGIMGFLRRYGGTKRKQQLGQKEREWREERQGQTIENWVTLIYKLYSDARRQVLGNNGKE